jgi:hypothetical protein
MFDEGPNPASEFQDGNDNARTALDAPEMAACWERFTRAQGFHARAKEKLKDALQWGELVQILLEQESLNFDAYRTAATAFAETWNESLQHHAAFEALIGARGSA